MRIVVVLPPARTSHEIDTLRAITGSEILVIADPAHHPTATHPARSWKIPWLGSARRWTAALAWLRGLRTLDLGEKGVPDMVVSLELFSVGSRQAARLARRWEVPHVVYVAEILDSNPLYRLPPWRGNTRRTVRQLDGVICSNRAGARHARSRGVESGRIVTVSPGVDTTVFRPCGSLAERPPVAISVGELRADKGVMDVIAGADAAIDRLPPDFRLVLVGDGPLRDVVDRAAEIRPWLEVRGKIPRHEVANELQSARAFVLAPHSRPFWAEQLGFAVLEAMACGLPLVVTDCGALSEVVPGHNRVVAEGDIAAIADGLIAALGPDGEEWGRRNLLVVEDCYTLTTQGARLGVELAALARLS